MPSFETPPDWWLSLANLTRWLHWPAISALFSASALGWAIYLADRGNRDKRRREATILTAILFPAGVSLNFEKKALDALKERPGEREKIILWMGNLPVWSDMEVLLTQIKVTDLPTTLAIDYYAVLLSGARTNPKIAQAFQGKTDAEVVEDMKIRVDTLERACRELAGQAYAFGARASKFDEAGVSHWLKQRHNDQLQAAKTKRPLRGRQQTDPAGRD